MVKTCENNENNNNKHHHHHHQQQVPCNFSSGHAMPQQGWLLFSSHQPGWTLGKGGELSPYTLCFSKGHPRGILVLDGLGISLQH